MKLLRTLVIFDLIYNLKIIADDHDFTDDGECHCGKRDDEYSSPWQVLIEPDNDKTKRCNGVLISRRHILTSANCLKYDCQGSTCR